MDQDLLGLILLLLIFFGGGGFGFMFGYVWGYQRGSRQEYIRLTRGERALMEAKQKHGRPSRVIP